MSIKKLLRPGAFIPLAMFVLLLLFVGVFALTREDDGDLARAIRDDPILAFLAEDEEYPEIEDFEAWIPPAPPRWFRSNAGGMALEEIPSRLAALRNEHALVIDFISPAELEPILRPFFRDYFDIEIRVLFERGHESRRQWLFVDEAGVVRLNAVFRRPTDVMDGDFYGIAFLDDASIAGYFEDYFPRESDAEIELDADPAVVAAGYAGREGYAGFGDPEGSQDSEDPGNLDDSADSFPEAIAYDDGDDEDEPAEKIAAQPPPGGDVARVAPVGFIEVFNENGRIVRDYLFAEDGSESLTAFFYNENLLIRAEAKHRYPDDPPGEFRILHTDHFRYNRLSSLRYVRRVFHEPSTAEPVRLTFPFDVLDAAFQDDFIRRRVMPGSDFIDTFDFDAGDGFNVRYVNDYRGRVLTQTMYDDDGEVVWRIRNVWEGDRIVAISRTEDGEERLTEFEFDWEGNRIVQREIRNGVLERLVRTDGPVETEELFMDGELVLVAHWEGGRRISEERVRR